MKMREHVIRDDYHHARLLSDPNYAKNIEDYLTSQQSLKNNNLLMFDSNQQNVLCNLSQPKNMKEWNTLMEQMVGCQESNASSESLIPRDECNYEEVLRIKLLRNRR